MKKSALLLAPVMAVALVAGLAVTPAPQAQAATTKAKISKVTVKGTTATVKIKKVKKAVKYQYKASTSKKFKSGVKTASTKKVKASFKKLSSGKWYFKARAQVKKGKKKTWGAWSSVKTATVAGSSSSSTAADNAPLKIEYVLDGGTLPAGAKTEVSSTDPYYVLPTPTKAGYEFDKWVDQLGYGETSISYSDKVLYETGTVTLYAQWTKNISISYVLNGGTLPQGTKTELTSNDAWYDLPTPTNADSSMTFEGWYTDPSFSESSKVGSVFFSDGDIAVYAKWSKNAKITYVLNGGTLPQGTKTELTSNDAWYDLPTPTNADSSLLFEGWYTDPSFSESSAISTVYYTDGDTTVYAKWMPASRTITYVLNGGTLPSYAQTSVAYDGWYILPDPTRSGYDFDGWYTNAQFDPNTLVSTWDYADGDVTLYAKWSESYD